MTPRERFRKTLTFDNPDRVFYCFGWPRRSTYAAWYLQGLPRMNESKAFGTQGEFSRFIGEDYLDGKKFPVETDTYPPFEREVLEETDNGRVWRDEMGIIMRDAGSSLNTPGFNTRSYVAHPVKNRQTWLRMAERFDPTSARRYPDNWDGLVREFKNRDHPIRMPIKGLYWKARDWVGFEKLSLMFYDDPELVHEMMEHITNFNMNVTERAMMDGMIDCISISEDMAYKHASMISPEMFREFMLPRYRRMISHFKNLGLPLVMVGTDGHLGQLIPLWIEAGIDGTLPLEIAAHNDPLLYHETFRDRIALWGGILNRHV